jgi:microcystin degradation protein MlrC
MTRVALAAVFHETNSFSALRTDETAFRAHGWLDGDVLVERYADTRTVMGGFLDGLSALDAAPVPAFGAYATPSGLVPGETFATIRRHLLARLREAEPFDGLLLELHGALVVDGEDDPEQVLCRDIRSLVGDRPVVAVTDLHANMTPARLATLDALVGYRTNPHGHS